MHTLVQCDNCSRQGMFKIELKVTPKAETCKECHHIATESHSFYFCNMSCFVEWTIQNGIYQEGVPCWHCYETGFSGGFEQNGTCTFCDGTKKVKL